MLLLATSTLPTLGAETTDSNTRGKPPDFRSDPQREAQLAKDVGEGFRLLRTSHFVIAYDVPKQTLEELFSRLEGTFYKVHRFCQTRDIPLDVSTTKLEVIFCDRWSTYANHARQAGVDPKGAYGFYHATSNRSIFYNIEHAPGVVELRKRVTNSKNHLAYLEDLLGSLRPDTDRVRLKYPDGQTATLTVDEGYEELDLNRARLRDTEVQLDRHVEQLNRTVIQHEVAHHVLFAGGVHVRGAVNPTWLVEGLAMQFETPPARPRQSPTTVNNARLGEFRDAHDQKRLIPLERLLSDNLLFVKNTPDRAISYAQAWALVYYLSRKRSDHFAAYVRALSARRPGESIAAEKERQEFCSFFGSIDRKFVSRWEKHILALPYRKGETGR
ncbi:MAG: DUF1570 domain-containing protein [Phycisphaerae bacterium]|nr:DUF1570 domain-containing protein [Phycisphaerae bacterium]